MTSDWSAGLFERSPALLARASLDGVLIAVTPPWAAALGSAPQPLVGRPLAELAHTDDRAAVERALRDGTTGEQRFAHADGSWRTLRWRAIATDDALELAAADVT